jgi:hypothetical protein
MKLLRDEHGQASTESLFLMAAAIIFVLLLLGLMGAFMGGVTLTNAHSQAEVRGAISNSGAQNLIS